MKKAGMKLNLSEDKVIVFGETIPLSCTSSGQYLLQLSDNKVNEVFLARPNGDLDKKSLWKLHIQFGHCSKLNLEKLLKNGKYKFAKENLDEIYTHCETCITNSKPVIKPITCVPISCSPNEVVAIDLHQLGPKSWYVHLICTFSRFSVASIVSSKKNTRNYRRCHEKVVFCFWSTIAWIFN